MHISQKTRERLANLKELRRLLLERSGARCEECGTGRPDFRGFQMSHTKQRGMGGNPKLDTLENTRLGAPGDKDYV